MWIGKPLDVAIPLTLDSSEDGSGLCLEAEVEQGDSRIPAGSVTVSLEPGSSPGTPRMRVRSTVAIEEPVVNVNVRAGCDTRSTRSYVMLADVLTEPALAALAPPVERAAPPVVRAPSRGTGTGTGAGAGVSPGEGQGAAPTTRRSPAAAPAARARDAESPPPRRSPPPAPRRPVAAAPPAVAPPAAVPRPAAPAAPVAPEPRREAAGGGARLRVDALEPVPALQGGLKTTPQLSLPATEDPARRAAAAADWRALNGDPEAAQREAQRNQALEATLAALREQTAQNQRALLELRSELAEARESRFQNPLVYALIVLLLIALAAIAMLWRLVRRASAPAWWGETPPKGEGGPTRPGSLRGLLDEDLEPDSLPPRRSANATTFGAATFAELEPDADSGFDQPHVHPVRTPDGAPVRPVNTEELFDVQQQSDFFLSLGQHDQAIAVLREHIATNPGTSALAYLDLLRIFHALGRREDYSDLAEEFERAFNADVPPFEHFNETGKGLEHYRSTLARIESQWPAPGTLALIEELVFRKPGTHGDEAFDLAAYQELLLLYSVAKEVIDPNSAPPAPVTPHSFVDTFGHDPSATTPAPLEPQTQPADIEEGPTLPASIYGAIDDNLHRETVLVPDAPPPAPAAEPVPARARPGVDMDLAEFDRTAFETMRAPIEAPPPPPAPSSDPHVIDFELFDPTTEAEIAPKPLKPVKPVKR